MSTESNQRAVVAYCQARGLPDTECARYSIEVGSGRDPNAVTCEIDCITQKQGDVASCAPLCEKKATQGKLWGIPVGVLLAGVGGAVLVAWVMRRQ